MLFCQQKQSVINSVLTKNIMLIIQRVTTICTLTIISIIAFAMLAVGLHAQAPAEIVEHHATITLQDGTGYIERNHIVFDLVEGVAIKARARDVVVAQTGTIKITYFDGQTTTLPPRSEIEIVFHDQTGDEQRVVLLQRAGRSINSVDKRASNSSRFEVQTPSSIATTDLTQFAVEVSNSQQVLYSSNTGTVKVFRDNKEPVQVESGQEATVEQGKPIAVAPMHNSRRTALFTKKVENSSCNDSRIQLKQPAQQKRGLIDFYGSATHEGFDYYKLEYTIIGRPANKYSWLHRGDKPVEDGLLASVDVSDLAAGEYVIRLQVVDKTGNYPESCSINLEIK